MSQEGDEFGSTASALSQQSIVLSEEVRTTSKGTFAFVRYIDEAGRFGQTALATNGREMPWADAVDVGIAPVIDASLQARLDAPGAFGASSTVKVDVLFRDEGFENAAELPHSERFDLDGDEYVVNGRKVTRRVFQHLSEAHAAQENAQSVLQRFRRAELAGELRGRSRHVSPSSEATFAAGNGPLVLELPITEVEAFAADNADLIGAMGYHSDRLDDDDTLATAMVETRTQNAINQGFTGTGVGVYMTVKKLGLNRTKSWPTWCPSETRRNHEHEPRTESHQSQGRVARARQAARQCFPGLQGHGLQQGQLLQIP